MQSIFKILMQGPIREDFNRTSTRSSHKDRYKIMQGLLRGFHHDLYKVFSKGPVEDLDQDLHARTTTRISQDLDTKDQLLLKRIFLEQLSRKHTKRQSIFQIFIARTSNTSGIVHYLQLATFGTSRYSCDKAGNQECWWRFLELHWTELPLWQVYAGFPRSQLSCFSCQFPVPSAYLQSGWTGWRSWTQLGKFSDNMSWFVLMLLEMELAVFDGCRDPEYASANGRDQGLVDYNRRLGPGSLVSSAQHEERDIFNALALSFMVRMTVKAPGQQYTFHSRLGLVTSSLVFVSVALVLGRSAPV